MVDFYHPDGECSGKFILMLTSLEGTKQQTIPTRWLMHYVITKDSFYNKREEQEKGKHRGRHKNQQFLSKIQNHSVNSSYLCFYTQDTSRCVAKTQSINDTGYIIVNNYSDTNTSEQYTKANIYI